MRTPEDTARSILDRTTDVDCAVEAIAFAIREAQDGARREALESAAADIDRLLDAYRSPRNAPVIQDGRRWADWLRRRAGEGVR